MWGRRGGVPLDLTSYFNILKQNPGSVRSVSVIKVGNVVIGVSGMALGCIVGDAQVVKARQEDQDPDDEDGHGSIRVLEKTKRHVST